MKDNKPLISTIKEKCRMCYTCVRGCPAKAIQVINGQADIVQERCIGCGHCILVCSQKAKKYYDSIPEAEHQLSSGSRVAAMLAPSFPAAFPNIKTGKLISMVRKLGFNLVLEVAFGADFVAHSYKNLVFNNPDKSYIATSCPGVVMYVEKYLPDICDQLAPIGSPMIITSRAIKKIYGEDIKTVFIGPCIAKKSEAQRYSGENGDEVSAVLTFAELQNMFKEHNISEENVNISDFDPPKPGLGTLFPLRGGMLQAADMRVNLLNSNILVADGKEDFARALEEYHDKKFSSRLLEVLCCKGCIMGAGMPDDIEKTLFSRRTAVSNYVKTQFDYSDLHGNTAMYHQLLKENLDMGAIYTPTDARMNIPTARELQEILIKLGKLKPEDELNCGACGYSTCREHAQAIFVGLAENEMCLPYTIERLKKSLEDLNVSRTNLVKTQEALFNAEKLASMGQLSAGIAHEINNPLGVILLNANAMLEDIEYDESLEEYREDIELIVEQANRCKKIVSGLLNFSRKNTLIIEAVNIDTLIRNSLRAIVKSDTVNIEIDNNFKDPVAEVHGDKITQVLVNLITNAIDAMEDNGTILIKAFDTEDDKIVIKVKDNGSGISQKHINKIFEPLFTTKQIGKGTGLGLAVTYGIIKTHKGAITVDTNANPEDGPTWTEFTITLPRKNNAK